MSPSFDEIVEWLKSLEEGEPLPKPTLVGRPAVMSQREPFPPAGAFPAAGAFPSPTALPAPASQLAQASQMADVARTEETPAEKPAAKPARPVELHDSSGSAVAADFLTSLHAGFSHENLAQGIVYAEILGKPAALRGPFSYRRQHR